MHGAGMRPAGRRFFLFNTMCEVALYRWPGDAAPLLAQCERLAQGVQRMLNRYDPGSELSRLSACYRPGKPYPVSRELLELLQALSRFAQASGGAFDYTVGPLVRLWNFTGKRPEVPAGPAIRRALERCGHRYVHCDEPTRTVTLDNPGMELDAGGAGKGYAVGLAADYLRRCGVESASVNFGGNLCVIGPCIRAGQPPRPWRVAVQQPWRERGETAGTLHLQDLAVATSGGYDRFFTADGKVYHHLLDPRTGYPVEGGLEGVSIVSDSPLLTDLLSTAYYVCGEKEGEALLTRLGGEHMVGSVRINRAGVRVSSCLQPLFENAQQAMPVQVGELRERPLPANMPPTAAE